MGEYVANKEGVVEALGQQVLNLMGRIINLEQDMARVRGLDTRLAAVEKRVEQLERDHAYAVGHLDKRVGELESVYDEHTNAFMPAPEKPAGYEVPPTPDPNWPYGGIAEPPERSETVEKPRWKIIPHPDPAPPSGREEKCEYCWLDRDSPVHVDKAFTGHHRFGFVPPPASAGPSAERCGENLLTWGGTPIPCAKGSGHEGAHSIVPPERSETKREREWEQSCWDGLKRDSERKMMDEADSPPPPRAAQEECQYVDPITKERCRGFVMNTVHRASLEHLFSHAFVPPERGETVCEHPKTFFAANGAGNRRCMDCGADLPAAPPPQRVQSPGEEGTHIEGERYAYAERVRLHRNVSPEAGPRPWQQCIGGSGCLLYGDDGWTGEHATFVRLPEPGKP